MKEHIGNNINEFIGKTITNIFLIDEQHLIIFFDNEYGYFKGSLGYENENEIYLVEPCHPALWRMDLVSDEEKLRMGIISQMEYDNLKKEKIQQEMEQELKQYERIKAKYNLT